MLTLMCPNCRHRFPAPGCCNPGSQSTSTNPNFTENNIATTMQSETADCTTTKNGAFYGGGGYLLVPRDYTNKNLNGCIINAPTIIHGSTIIQQPIDNHHHHHHHHHHRIATIDKIHDSQNFVAKNDEIHKHSHNHRQTKLSNFQNIFNNAESMNLDFMKSAMSNNSDRRSNCMDCQINTTCDLTGGTVTITTPGIQSGGCLIQTPNTELQVESPRIEIRPKLSGGGGCYVQKRLSIDDDDNSRIIYRDDAVNDIVIDKQSFLNDKNLSNEILLLPPSGCQELPGTRHCSRSSTTNDKFAKPENLDFHDENFYDDDDFDFHRSHDNHHRQSQRQQLFGNVKNEKMWKKRNSDCCCGKKSTNLENSCETMKNRSSITENSTDDAETTIRLKKNNFTTTSDDSNAMEIRVNATVKLSPNVEHCTVNITATTGKKMDNDDKNDDKMGKNFGKSRNTFNGGGLIKIDANVGNFVDSEEAAVTERRGDDAPTTPISWLIPCPWQFDNYSPDKEITRLADIKRSLHTSGWYHEGISWQQSELLLKNSSIGSWLMRDSSDSRFIFAVSVQTNRGPTSVRVHYFLGKFRLDAEPRLSHNMPCFDCPIKMLEHYVDYSNKIVENRKEVWVDYSGQIYSQIYLTKPLVKEVRSLSHLARIVVNKNKIFTKHLPGLMKNYLAEYPYSL